MWLFRLGWTWEVEGEMGTIALWAKLYLSTTNNFSLFVLVGDGGGHGVIALDANNLFKRWTDESVQLYTLNNIVERRAGEAV